MASYKKSSEGLTPISVSTTTVAVCTTAEPTNLEFVLCLRIRSRHKRQGYQRQVVLVWVACSLALARIRLDALFYNVSN